MSSIVDRDVQGKAFEEWLDKAERTPDAMSVDFDRAWRFMGYSTKGNAHVVLKKNFELGREYSLLKVQKTNSSGKGVHMEDIIMMKIDTFKKFCLIAATTEGNLAREYFIDAEKKFRTLKRAAEDGELQYNPKKKRRAELAQRLEYCNDRIDAAEANVSAGSALATLPGVDQAFYVNKNIAIAQTITGRTPAAIKKELNMKPNQSSRTAMGKAQLTAAKLLEYALEAHANAMENVDEVSTAFNDDLAHISQVCMPFRNEFAPPEERLTPQQARKEKVNITSEIRSIDAPPVILALPAPSPVTNNYINNRNTINYYFGRSAPRVALGNLIESSNK